MKTPKFVIPPDWARSMLPPHGVDLVIPDIGEIPTLQLYLRPRWHYGAVALSVALFWLCCFAFGRLRAVESRYAAPTCDSRTDEGCR